MNNELLIIISLLVSYGLLLVSYGLFGRIGVFIWIAVCTILANIEVSVLVTAFGIEQTLGNTLFASSFLATDILSECYGKKEGRKGVFVGTFSALVFILISFMWQFYNPSENDILYPTLKTLFSHTPRILISSMIAFFVSEFLDVQLYHAIWKFTRTKSGDSKKFLWLRNNSATLLSQLINIVIFNFGAFTGIYEFKTLVFITMSCYLIFIFTSLLDTPFIYFARKIHFVRHRK
ncbi:MAG: queuosine precursor transporter [Treponemataceae bacterium]